MRKISSTAELKASIRELELKTERQEQALKEQARTAAKSLKPMNLLKLGVSKFTSTPAMKTTAINTFIGLAAGYITRKLVVGKSRNIFKKTLGAAVQAGITKYIHKRLPGWQQKSPNLLLRNSYSTRRNQM